MVPWAAMIADRFTEERERNRALGIALAFISFGFLFAPPFGGVLYQFCGKEVPFLFLACVALIDAAMLLLVSSKNSRRLRQEHAQVPHAPIYKLLLDPDVLVISAALIMANISLAFLEPTIATWMEDSMDADQWQQGIIWLPGFFPHIFGVYLCVQLSNKYAKTQYIYAGIGLCVIGFSTCFIPACTTFTLLILPICGMCFGVALVDTALIPALSYLVDSRYTSVYGSVYAIADISYSLAYAFGPVVSGWMVHIVGFTFLNIIVGLASCIYAPSLYSLRKIYGEEAEFRARRQEETNLLDNEELNMPTTVSGNYNTTTITTTTHPHPPPPPTHSFKNISTQVNKYHTTSIHLIFLINFYYLYAISIPFVC